MLKSFKTYMFVENKVDITGNKEFEISPKRSLQFLISSGKYLLILGLTREGLVSIPIVCISYTGNGSCNKGNKNKNPDSNYKINENNKKTRHYRIYIHLVNYILISKRIFHLTWQCLIS